MTRRMSFSPSAISGRVAALLLGLAAQSLEAQSRKPPVAKRFGDSDIIAAAAENVVSVLSTSWRNGEQAVLRFSGCSMTIATRKTGLDITTADEQTFDAGDLSLTMELQPDALSGTWDLRFFASDRARAFVTRRRVLTVDGVPATPSTARAVFLSISMAEGDPAGRGKFISEALGSYSRYCAR